MLGALALFFSAAGGWFVAEIWLDPTGARFASDGTPLGPPPGTGELLVILAQSLVLLGIGMWLAFARHGFTYPRRQHARMNSTQDPV